jgi:hypothetical protein
MRARAIESAKTLKDRHRSRRNELLQVGEKAKTITATILVPLHRVPPPKESMKAFLDNRRLKRAYFFYRNSP